MTSRSEPTAAHLAELVGRLRRAGCVYAEDEAALLVAAASGADDLDAMADRRTGGEPIEHVVGWAAFGGLRVAVTRGVFVPRVRTEHLASLAAALALDGASGGVSAARPVVVDLCCGSGAIALVVAARVPAAEVHASDIDPAAVACARANLAPVGATVHQGDLDTALPVRLRGRVDVLVANVPYVPSEAVATLPGEARRYETVAALDGGPDGLALVRRVAAVAARWLRPGGAALVEAAPRQAMAAAAAFAAHGLSPTVVTDDDREVAAVVARAPRAG